MFGFALLGPFNEPYQIPEIGYHIQGDIGAPKNKGEEYRWNTRTVFYAYDENFLDYFGSNGVAAVDQAIGIMNALTNLSSYSSDLSEIPQRAARFNSTALSLSLLDLKTSALHALMEQLGLAEPERYVWTLHNRFLTPQGTCPLDETYTVIKRNFDPVTTDYSSYVNGVLYSYFIVEICTGPDPLAQTVGFPVDPTEPGLTAVAGRNFGEGIYYTGLTRDDVGGLRYLMGTNRLHVESVEPTSQLIVTNNNSELLVTSDLALFS
ncbi:MAG: Ig family protein, partial [Pedosphaera sp.]|nr:Ig family protein [Pedosphaera sp.]